MNDTESLQKMHKRYMEQLSRELRASSRLRRQEESLQRKHIKRLRRKWAALDDPTPGLGGGKGWVSVLRNILF